VVKASPHQELAISKALQKELKEKEAQYRSDGIDPDTVPKDQGAAAEGR
jgi:hypothetical protein